MELTFKDVLIDLGDLVLVRVNLALGVGPCRRIADLRESLHLLEKIFLRSSQRNVDILHAMLIALQAPRHVRLIESIGARRMRLDSWPPLTWSGRGVLRQRAAGWQTLVQPGSRVK